jgi:hypothetical protein
MRVDHLILGVMLASVLLSLYAEWVWKRARRYDADRARKNYRWN